MKMRKIVMGWTVAVCAVSLFLGISSSVVRAENADLNADVAAIQGVNATYDSANASEGSMPNSVIAVDTGAAYASGGSRFVAFQYQLTVGNAFNSGKYGFEAGTSALNGGHLYGKAEAYLEDCGNFFRYAENNSPFLSSVGKTVTAVFDRAAATCAVYTSPVGAEIAYDVSSGFTVVGATAVNVDFSENYYVISESTKNALLTGRAPASAFTEVSQNTRLAALVLGDGTATLKNIRAFDERGNALPVTLGGDFTVTDLTATTGYLSTGASADTALSAAVNLSYKGGETQNEATAYAPNAFDSVRRSGIYHAADHLFTHTLKEGYGATLTTRGSALVLHFGNAAYKAQIDFGKSVALSGVESVTFRAYSPAFATGAGEIYLFNTVDELTTVGQDCVALNAYLPDTISADYAEITLPADALAPLADGEGNLSGVQFCYLSGGSESYFVLDEVTYEEKQTPKLYMTAGAVMRLAEPTGLGFITNIDYAYYRALIAQYGAENVATGTLIVPADKIPEAGLTKETLTEGNVTHLDIPNEGFLNESTAEADGRYFFRGSIVKILPQNLTRRFVGRGYVAVTANGKTEYLYAAQNDNARSVQEVAQKAYDFVSDGYDEETDCVRLITYANHPAVGKYSPYTTEQLQALENYLS